MKISIARTFGQRSPRGFTLVELMVAMVASIALVGSAFLLVIDTGMEQRNGLADTTVEQKAYTLEANITSTLRVMSANQGMTPVGSSQAFDGSGNFLGYQSIFVFTPTNGGYALANIAYNPTAGVVTFTPNMANPAVQTVWMSNTPTATLSQLTFTPSANMDGSQDSSLINVTIQMNDNGFSQQNPSNNPASLDRTFSVQMRNDY